MRIEVGVGREREIVVVIEFCFYLETIVLAMLSSTVSAFLAYNTNNKLANVY